MQELGDHCFIIVHNKDEDFGFGEPCTDLPRHLNAVYKRQCVPNHGDVGLGLDGLLYRFFAVAGNGNNLPTGPRFNDPH
jgi:hypothetical protein